MVSGQAKVQAELKLDLNVFAANKCGFDLSEPGENMAVIVFDNLGMILAHIAQDL